jgi:hypothetical protein
MNHSSYIILLSILLSFTSCITQFIPVIEEDKELLVVQGFITDQNETDTIKLSRSLPLGLKKDARPVKGCFVTISDDKGTTVSLSEISAGTYITPESFRAIVGNTYTLHINANQAFNNYNYESAPMKMKAVPPIDSIYYEKTVIEKADGYFKGVDGCQIYLDTHDPLNNCRFYRWDFSETWVLRLLFPVVNMTCWISDKSNSINIKSTIAFDEDRVAKHPVNYITNVTDRLQRKYSINVNQYSLNQDEYQYWEKIQNISDQVGGLYDLIPSSVQGNMSCIEDPGQKVLGYFSVSAKSSKRIFIKDSFEGIIDRYNNCVLDTIPYIDPPGLGVTVWIINDSRFALPPFRVLTDKKGCADCTVRGTNIKPSYWQDDK